VTVSRLAGLEAVDFRGAEARLWLHDDLEGEKPSEPRRRTHLWCRLALSQLATESREGRWDTSNPRHAPSSAPRDPSAPQGWKHSHIVGKSVTRWLYGARPQGRGLVARSQELATERGGGGGGWVRAPSKDPPSQ
jgi:hypothetical protein